MDGSTVTPDLVFGALGMVLVFGSGIIIALVQIRDAIRELKK